MTVAKQDVSVIEQEVGEKEMQKVEVGQVEAKGEEGCKEEDCGGCEEHADEGEDEDMMNMLGGMGGKGGGKGADMAEMMKMLGGMGGDGAPDMSSIQSMLGGGGMGGMGGKGMGKGMGPADDAEREEDGYYWNQKGDEIQIRIPNTTATKNDVKCTFKRSAIKIEVCGESIVEGKLFGSVDAEDCTWAIEKGVEVQVMLTKQEDKRWTDLLA